MTVVGVTHRHPRVVLVLAAGGATVVIIKAVEVLIGVCPW